MDNSSILLSETYKHLILSVEKQTFQSRFIGLVKLIFSELLLKGSTVLLTNSQAFEVEAYKDIEGTPYYFEKWQQGKVYSKNAEDEQEQLYLLNFNGYTKSFEVRKDERFITLDEKFYEKITIEIEEEDVKKTLVFKTNSHPIYKNRFMKVVFEGTDFFVIQDFQKRLVEREKKSYNSGTVKVQEFSNNPTYYLVKNKKAKSFKLKKKAILPLLKSQDGAMKSYVKNNKLKLNNESELIQIMSYYEQLSYPNSTVASNDN